MAFLDFLGQGVGGTTPAQTTPGLMGEGNITTQPAMPIGPTYGDIAKGAMQYGSKPGSSAPAIASSMPGNGWQQRSMQPLLAPNAPAQSKTAMGEGSGEQDQNLAAIAKFLSMLFSGAGAGVGGV